MFPEIPSARVLTPLELNKIRFTDKHTVITPEMLEDKNPQSPIPNTTKKRLCRN